MEGCKNFTEEGQLGGLGSRPPTAAADFSPSILLLGVMVLSEESANTKVDVKANKYEAVQEQCTSSAGDIFIVLLYQATSRFEQQVLSFRSDTSRICFHVASRIVRRDQHFHEVESVSGALDTQMEVILDTNYNIYIHIYISI